MKGNRNESVSRCDTPGCAGKVQAACFKCSKLFCFQCALSHAQQSANRQHVLLEMQEASKNVQKISAELLARIRDMRLDGQKENKADQQDHNSKLHPERFQQQLDEISFMKKETFKVVEKFYSQISLELVNMWEFYLKKYSGLEQTLQHLSDLEARINPFASHNSSNGAQTDLVRCFLKEEFQKEVRICKEKISVRTNDLKSTPKCPSVRIDDRVLVELSEVLCSAISTVNYTSQEDRKDLLHLNVENTLSSSVKQLPIFPIKKPHCYLFDLKAKTYEIQQFNNLDYLPDNPKTIVIPNGDIHIVGGVKKKDALLNTHLVFRSSSSEVFKLADLPYAVNPSNSLLYHNKFIYLIGGMLEHHEWTKRCLRYNLEIKEWLEISSMANPKPHQSSVVFNDSIYCFGIPQNKKINIQRYDIFRSEWEDIIIKNFLSNPFNFASGFTAIQINEHEIFFLGGKKFLENVINNKRSTDRELTPNTYIFRPQTNSFAQLGRTYPCLGVQYGEFTPVVFEGNIYFCEYLLSKNNPIARWYDNIHVLQLSGTGMLESVAILNEE